MDIFPPAYCTTPTENTESWGIHPISFVLLRLDTLSRCWTLHLPSQTAHIYHRPPRRMCTSDPWEKKEIVLRIFIELSLVTQHLTPNFHATLENSFKESTKFELLKNMLVFRKWNVLRWVENSLPWAQFVSALCKLMTCSLHTLIWLRLSAKLPIRSENAKTAP